MHLADAEWLDQPNNNAQPPSTPILANYRLTLLEAPFPPLRQLCEAFESDLGIIMPKAPRARVWKGCRHLKNMIEH